MTEKKINQFFTSHSSGRVKRPKFHSSPELVENSDTCVPRSSEMENEKVGNLTHCQLMEDLSVLFDKKLSTLATKQDLVALSSEVRNLSEENKVLKQELADLKKQEQFIISKLNDMESRLRRNNLIFKGLKWNGKVDFRSVVKQFCVDVLGCSDRVWVNRAHPIGGREGRTIIAHFPDDSDLDYIMSNTRKLKGTGYVVHRDYTREVRQKRAYLTAIRAEIERVHGRRRMPLIVDRLIVGECRLSWEDNKLMAGKDDGVERLRDILDLDLSDFIKNLAQKGPAEQRRPTPDNEEKDEMSISMATRR